MIEDLHQQALDMQAEIEASAERVGVDELLKQKMDLDQKTKAPGFWNETKSAQDTTKRLAKLDQRINPWLDLQKDVDDLLELISIGDETMRPGLSSDLNEIFLQFAALKKDLEFSGPHDSSNAILSIYAGAGGTDAQDWAQMLHRMYVRWAEQNDYKVKTIDETAGDEAGLKSVTIEIKGHLVYGKLKGEHGVHRLVRLSPFNANNLRQTSFAKVEVLPEVARPEDVDLDEKELRIDVYRAGGHGGQSVNTTDSAVRITHMPTGISVAIQNERSQLQNKETALTILRSKLVQLQAEQHKEKLSELKGPNQSAEWGNQIRSYVLHPYKQVKDLRTKYETSDAEGVLGGDISQFIDAYSAYSMGQNLA